MTATQQTVNDDPYRRAIDQWRAQNVPLLPPATNEDIEAAFVQLNHPVSNDVRRLYTVTRGFDDYESDNYLWSLWSLNRIVEENKDNDSKLVWFADWLICSHVYAFHYNSPETSSVYIDYNSSQHPPKEIACDVAEFLRKYVDDPDSVEAFDLDK